MTVETRRPTVGDPVFVRLGPVEGFVEGILKCEEPSPVVQIFDAVEVEANSGEVLKR